MVVMIMGGDDNGQLWEDVVDLQPLPSLSKPQLVPAIVSPPAMSFDDDEGEEVRNDFYTLHGSNASK
ncbi:hypothetical protein Tco_1496602 [Tanacetum coccineum]